MGSGGYTSQLPHQDVSMHGLQLLIGLRIVAADLLQRVKGTARLLLAENSGELEVSGGLLNPILGGHPVYLSLHIPLEPCLVALVVREMTLILVFIREVLTLLLDGWADLRGQLAEELQALLLISSIYLLLIFKHPVGVDL